MTTPEHVPESCRVARRIVVDIDTSGAPIPGEIMKTKPRLHSVGADLFFERLSIAREFASARIWKKQHPGCDTSETTGSTVGMMIAVRDPHDPLNVGD